MLRAKYLFATDVVTKDQLKAAGLQFHDDVEHYEIRPVDRENPVLDDSGQPTGKFLSDVVHDQTVSRNQAVITEHVDPDPQS